jgi:DNA-directed RNA polymerase subunit RPC12/RpoP
MDEHTVEREGPATRVECPWCGGDVELRERADDMACERCRIVVAFAPDATRGTSDGSRRAVAAAA